MKQEEPEAFVPLFKEKSESEQFRFENDKWIKTNESTIMSMWYQWGKREDQSKYEDEDKFTIYGYIKNEEKVLSIKEEKKYTEEDLRKAIDFIPYHLEHGNLVARLSDKDVEDFIKNLNNV